MSNNRVIANAPIYIPLLVAAALVLVTWYRPALPRMPEGALQAPQAGEVRSPDGRASGKP